MKNILTILSAFLTLLVFSCHSPGNDKVRITVLAENSATIQSMMDMKKDYEGKHPNIELDFKPNTFDDAFKKSNQDFANKTGIYDLVIQYNFTLSSSVRNGYVYLIDDLTKNIPDSSKAFEKDIFPKLWEEIGFYYKDAADASKGLVKVGYPSAGLSMLLMYNKAMFSDQQNKMAFSKKYGTELKVPYSWQEFYKVAEFFTNKEKKTFGVCIEGATGGFLYYEYVNYLYGLGGKVMDKEKGWHGDETTPVLLTSPESVAALKYYKSLKPFNAGNFTDVEQFEQMKIMKEGKTAMAIVWSDMIYPAIKSVNIVDTAYGFAQVPGNKSILGGGSYFINKETKHPKETAGYVIDLMQHKTQQQLAAKGLCSPLMSVYDEPNVKKLPYANALKQSLQRGGIGLEAAPDANMVSEVITTYIQKVWSGQLSEEEGMKQAKAEIEAKRKNIFSNLKK